MLVHVFIRAHQDLLILRRPRPILVLGAIDTGPVALVFLRRRLAGRRLAIHDRLPVSARRGIPRAICSIGGACPWGNRVGWLERGAHDAKNVTGRGGDYGEGKVGGVIMDCAGSADDIKPRRS